MTNTDLEKVVKPLRAWRGLAEMTQAELAEKVGVTARTIGEWEKDTSVLSNVSHKRLQALAKALDIEVENIYL